MNSAAKIIAIQELIKLRIVSEDYALELFGISRFKLELNELFYVRMTSQVKVLNLND